MQNVKIVILKEFQIVTMIINIRYETKEGCIMKKLSRKYYNNKYKYMHT